MRACVEYKIVYEKGTDPERTLALLADRVNALLLLDDWQPIGGIQAVHQGLYVHASQAMAQYSKDES